MIEWNASDGRLAEALPNVKQRLNGYLSHYDRIKIGATTDPTTRWELGYNDGTWSKMVVLYKAPYPGSVRSMEKKLIAYARTTNFRVRPENVRPGGENIRDGDAQYFVYVVVA